MGKLGLNIKTHPLFLFTILLLVYLGWLEEIIIYILVLLIHEYSHYYIAKKLGYKLNNIVLMPYGASLNGSKIFFKPNHEIIISLSGPLSNIILAVVTIAIWWIFPVAYNYTNTFVFANLSLAFFNLLPIFPLDAGRILVVLLNKKLSYVKTYKIFKFNSYLFSTLFIVLFIISAFYKINLTFLFIAFFLIVSTLDYNDMYYNYAFLEKNPDSYKNILEIKTYIVPSNTPIYKLSRLINKNTYSVFIFVDEKGNTIKKVDEKELILNYNKNN